MELSIFQYVAAGAILLLASVLQGMVGFASGLFGIPLLLLSGFSLPQAVMIILLAAVIQTVTGSLQLRREIDFRRIWRPVLIRLSALPLGVATLWYFTSLDQQLVKQIVGVFLLLVVLTQWLLPAASMEAPHPIWEWPAFFLSGYLLGVCGMGGPPMALWVMAQNWSTRRSRAFLFFVLMTGMLPQAFLLWYLFGDEVLQAAMIGVLGIPLVLLGTALGLRLGSNLPRAGWRRLTYAILALIAVSAIVTPLFSDGASAKEPGRRGSRRRAAPQPQVEPAAGRPDVASGPAGSATPSPARSSQAGGAGSHGDQDAPAPLPPDEAARTMQVPEGFQVTLFAGEPDVVQPVGFCIDDRGRLWVAEALNYPHRDRPPRDRIVILEDRDGDGRFDQRTVFFDRLNYVSGLEVGFGGVWVMSPPWFYFIPDRDGDDVPDGPAQVLLDGFGAHANAHNMANGFAWGPDGWLYGTHGRTNWSLPGKPGTPDAERRRFDGGVWRYHPTRHVWEEFADGTTNPWGIDFDDYGQGFVCNCVNPHLFHVIQGAHYEPWRNRKSSQYAYERIETIADHLHFLGGENVRAALGTDEELAAGGGHAHCGTMVYLGDNWPDRYRNTVFMNNIHGRRINNDVLRRKGSGYTASHAADILIARDPWYMGVTLQYGPDGGVFASDWSDTGECHSIRNTQVGTGRIYKITWGVPEHRAEDVSRLSDQELVRRQLHANDWHVRHARRVLQERAAAGHDMQLVHDRLRDLLDGSPQVPQRLRALWALHVTGGLPDDHLMRLLEDRSEYVRAWAVRLLCEGETPNEAALEKFRQLAATGDSPFVRLHLASALQRLPLDRRWTLAEALIARAEDAGDANLPLMIWYGIEPLVHEDLERFVRLAVQSRLPLIRRHVARRATSLTP